jgi:hypothetical protein
MASFRELVKEQRKSGSGIFSSLGSAALGSTRESMDIKNRLFKSGTFLNTLFPNVKGYKAGIISGTSKLKNVDKPELGNATPILVKKLDDINKNTKITAMGIISMKHDIAKLVKIQGGPTSRKKADKFFDDAKKRGGGAPPRTSTSPFGGIGSLFGSIGKGVGGLIGGVGSVIGGIFSAAGGILGGLGSIFGGIVRSLSSLGLPGIILAIGGAFLISKLFGGTSETSSGGMFGSLEKTFDEIGKSIKKFFGLDTKENEGKTFFQIMTGKLDTFFGTTKFTDGFNLITETTMAHLHATFSILRDSFLTIGDMVVASVANWFDENRVAIYGMIGTVVGAAYGLKGAALGAAVGTAVGYVKKTTDVDRQEKIKTLENNIKNYEASMERIKDQPSNLLTKQNRDILEKKLKDDKEELETIKEERRIRNPLNRTRPSYEDYLNEGREKFKMPSSKPYPGSTESNESRISKPYPDSRSSRSTSPRKFSDKQIAAIDLLNRLMDEEGVNDPQVRNTILALAQRESTMNPNSRGPVIPKGMHKGDQAHGLLQIMPKTAEDMGFSRQDIQDPEKAARAGLRYFLKNYKRTGSLEAAVVSHHAGPKIGTEFLRDGIVRTKDTATNVSTMDYLADVMSYSKNVGSDISTASTQIADARTAMAAQTQPNTTNVNQINNVDNSGKNSSSGGQQAETFDVDLIKLLLSTQS